MVRKRQYNAREPQVRPPRETLLPLMLFAIFNTPLFIKPPPPPSKVLEKKDLRYTYFPRFLPK